MRHEKSQREAARGRKEIMLKKVIISARGFAVAWTTNKAEAVGRCAQQKGLKRNVNSSGERAGSCCTLQPGNIYNSVSKTAQKYTQ